MRWAIVCVVAAGWRASAKSSTPTSVASTGSGSSASATNSEAAGVDVGPRWLPTEPPPPGCKRLRKTFVYNCSGMPPGPGESNTSPAEICDNCLSNADCTDKPGGECRQTGDQMCTGPAHLVCRYPDPACGNQICPEPVVAPPP